jgi:hypothetical protein
MLLYDAWGQPLRVVQLRRRIGFLEEYEAVIEPEYDIDTCAVSSHSLELDEEEEQ